MRSLGWLKKAALATALFVAGVVAGDLAVRGGHSAPLPEVAQAPVQVVHKRKVRTVHLHPRPAAASGAPATTPASAAVVSAPSATPVSSRTSPGAAGGEGDDGAEAERGD